jgi:hypothetical protein
MISLVLASLFIGQLGLALALLWLWWRLKDRMAAMEAKAGEALEGQDLMEFQERITALLGQVREAGREVVAMIDERRAGLDREGARAREAEKRLAEKIKGFERVEEKARRRLAEWASGQAKTAARHAPEKKPGKGRGEPLNRLIPAPEPSAGEPSKVTYLKRDFRAPEAQAPLLPRATRYLKVYEMADAGKSREEISKACGYLPGEVELILNLRPRPRG